MQLKLNYGRTILIGLAFMSICAFWQLYDGIIPLILRDTYGVKDGPSGIIMSIDNILALFLLPAMGAFSDKKGRRMPFILIGTAIAAVLMIALPLFANTHAVNPAQGGLITFMVVLGMLLVAMGCYRSPAVALMADVTPKPLRSKGNAIINLMGALGGLYALQMVSHTVVDRGGREDYLYLFISVAALMVVAIAVLWATIRERKLVQQMKEINYGVSEDEDQGRAMVVDGKEKLPPAVKKSLILILATIVLWFMGYNAVTTAFTKFATATWHSGLDKAADCLTYATVAAVISYIPIGFLSSKFGRKRMIQLGLLVAIVCFVLAAIFANEFSPWLYPIFIFTGFAQAAITVNTFPMVWEISRLGNVGRYTGYYYTCSMAAQIATPILSGYMIQWFSYKTLFPYAAIMVAAAIIPICFAKHGDSKPERKASRLEAFDTSD